MMRFAQVLFSAMLVAAAAVQADAAPRPVVSTDAVPAPDWRVGSTWDYSDGYKLRVASAANGTTVFERVDAPGQ